MKNNNAKKLLSKVMQKEAQLSQFRKHPLYMPDLPGSANYKTRTLQSNIRWKSFNLNQFAIELSKLPDEIKKSITNQLRRFEKLFSKYPSSQHEDFRNLVRVAYCEDTLITDELKQYLATSPALLETAKFVKDNGLQLSPEAYGTSKGQQVAKGINSAYWFSKFGYAFMQDYPEAIRAKGASVYRKLRANVTGEEIENKVNGTFQVVPVGQGFTFAIVCNEGTTYIFNSTVDAEQNDEEQVGEGRATYNPRTKTKFFREEKILMGKTAVVIPDFNSHEIYFIPADLANAYVANKNVKEAAKRKSTKLTEEDIAAYKEKFDQVSDLSNKIFKISTDETGAIYVQKQKKYARFGRPPIDPLTKQKIIVDYSIGEKIYLNRQQVEFLANPNALNSLWIVEPAVSGEDASNAEIAGGVRYYYDIEDEQVRQKIYNPNPNNPREYAKSIPALMDLKNKIDEFTQLRTQGDVSQAHTALEGFKIYMVAPDFSAAADVGRGLSTGTRKGTEFDDIAGIQQNEEKGPIVHSKTFVVVAQQIPVARMVAAGRVRASGKLAVPEWRQVGGGFVSFKEAIAYMNEKIRGEGGVIEDFAGNIIDKKDMSPISETARSVAKGEQVMDEFRDKPQPQLAGEPLKINEPNTQNTINNEDQAIEDDDQNRRTRAFIDKIFRRYS
jgi:hypothetical protein